MIVSGFIPAVEGIVLGHLLRGWSPVQSESWDDIYDQYLAWVGAAQVAGWTAWREFNLGGRSEF